jgi:hypothetical protein
VELSLLDQTSNRPWPLPKRPWIMKQVWRDLLFAHWPVAVEALRTLVPAVLALDAFNGDAWVSIAPFHMEIQPRGLPRLSELSNIPELNCRTYVTVDGKPGVYFFSLDITSRLLVWGARTFYHLPYFQAKMSCESSGESISYASRRGNATWRATYEPISEVQLAALGTIEHFLTERYCLYAVHGRRVYRGEIHHAPWPLQQVHAEIQENTIAQTAGISLQGQPSVLSFAREIEVLIWWPQIVDR